MGGSLTKPILMADFRPFSSSPSTPNVPRTTEQIRGICTIPKSPDFCFVNREADGERYSEIPLSWVACSDLCVLLAICENCQYACWPVICKLTKRSVDIQNDQSIRVLMKKSFNTWHDEGVTVMTDSLSSDSFWQTVHTCRLTLTHFVDLLKCQPVTLCLLFSNFFHQHRLLLWLYETG